ncbi:MAG: ethanolamine utilization protein EutQ [Gaiellales bacterium]|jgi:ethanolamine utilization protein EutQ|nr:ethanolamine utilization protein EutQ [Gaiellales bacterium]
MEGVFVFAGESEKRVSHDYGQPVEVAVWEPLEGSSDTLTAGTVTYEGRFDWTFKYDISFYVLEGELTFRSGEDAQTARVGDIAVIHRGATVTFDAPARCRAFWSIYPSNWMELSDLPGAK